ncbi:nucleotidyltransferase substrate binding protein [Desulfobacter postgatei]|uniref:nucleotidyltransferase substrate binding protein n=1 Tax=Desulfobacter postgatei TaxID=2293 RepID=UPI00259B32FC|nr:nucleotidyltransferase substrate binding protein [uncultured Desulfobacter sp.]
MSNADEIRWKQRFENFEKAVLLLQESLEAKPVLEYSRLEQEGIVQRFEYTFELAWKTLKDRLYYEGYDEKTPRSVIRRAFETGFLSEDETEIWLDSLEKRNLLSHTYNEKTALAALKKIEEEYGQVLKKVYERLRPEAKIE